MIRLYRVQASTGRPSFYRLARRPAFRFGIDDPNYLYEQTYIRAWYWWLGPLHPPRRLIPLHREEAVQ